MPTGTLEIEVPEVGIVEFPADTKQEDIEAILNRTYGPKATPQVPEFKSPIELPPVKPGEKSVYEEPTWMDEPTVKLGDFLIKGPHEAKSPTEEGINKTLREGINSLTSPRNLLYMLGSMGVAATGQAAKALVGALWTGAMGANAIQNAPQLYARMGEEMAKPPEERDKELLGELGTQAFIDTGFFVAPALGLKSALTETPKLTPKPEVTDASKVQETTTVHGDVRPQPVESAREVPVEESGGGVQPPETPQGKISLTPEQQAIEQVRLAKELGEEEQPAAVPEATPVQEPKAGAAGTEPVSETQPSKALAEVPQEAKAETDWDAFNEHLRDDLDSFAPARTSGKVDYDLMDVADRFVEYAKTQPAGSKMSDLVKDFAKSDEASSSQISKLRKSIKSLESQGLQPPQEKPISEPTQPAEAGGKEGVAEATRAGVAKEPWQMTAEEAVKVTGLTWDKWQDAITSAEKSGKLQPTDPVSVSAAKTGYQDWSKLKSEAQKQPTPPVAAPEGGKAVTRRKFSEAEMDYEGGGTARFRWFKHPERGWMVIDTKFAGENYLKDSKREAITSARKLNEAYPEDPHQIVSPPAKPTPAAPAPSDVQKLSGPGTPAAAQPPDPKAAIEALEESFRNIRGPRPTLAEQVRKAFSVGEKAARAKDAVSSAVQGLKSSGDYLINKWKGEPKLDNMLRAKGELSAELEARGWRVRKFVKTVEKAMPTQRQRAAVLKWVDAGGDPAELQRGLDQTRPEFKQAYQDALNLKGDDLIAAQNIRSYFEERLQDAMDAGVLQQGVEDYIHRLYERDPKTQKQALAYVQSGLLQQNPALVKKRVFQFDWEAERAGRRPIQDFLPRIANYESSLSRAIAAREFVRKMVGFEEGNKRIPGMKAPDGRPVIDVSGLGVPVEDAAGVREATLIKPSFKPGDEADPKNNRRDYVERDYPALRKWRWTTLDAGGKPIFVQGNLLIHPDFVGRVDALLEPSRVKYGRYPKLGRAALGASSTVKQTMLDLSGFHQVQITVHGMEHKVMPWRIVKDIDFQNPNMDGLLKGGLTLGGEYYSAHHGEGLVGSALTRHIPILGPLMESYHNWLFQSYIPRIKTTMALAALERNRARYKGQLTEEQIYTKTANEANSAFGELNYIMLERSKTTQDIARLVMLAPDFLEARGRFAGGALEKGGKLGGHEQRAALLLGALTMYITARIANKLTDDKYHFEPENAFSLVHDGHAYSLRTVQGDILHLLEQPLQFWMNRLNPVFGRTLLQLTTGRDYFGRKRTVAETLWDSVKNTVPIALRSSQERKLWESMMNSMGVTARRWNDVDKAFTLAKDWKKQHGITEPGEFIYDPEKDPLRGLKIALSRSDDAGAAQEIRKVLASKVYTREKLNAYFDRYAKMPFTGSAANDRKWMATLTDDQRKIVEGARQHKIALRNMYRQSRAKFDDLMKTPMQ